MENDNVYSPRSALRDAAQARVDMARKSIFTPIDYLYFALIGIALAMQAAAQVADGVGAYVLLALSMVIILGGLAHTVRRSARAGFISRWSAFASISRGPVALFVAGLLVFLVSLPVRDIFGLTPWLPVYAVLVTLLCVAASTWWMSRLARRELADAQRELADAERELARFGAL